MTTSLGESTTFARELQVHVGALHELGPEAEDALVDSFVNRVGPDVDRYIDNVAATGPRARHALSTPKAKQILDLPPAERRPSPRTPAMPRPFLAEATIALLKLTLWVTVAAIGLAALTILGVMALGIAAMALMCGKPALGRLPLRRVALWMWMHPLTRRGTRRLLRRVLASSVAPHLRNMRDAIRTG